MFALLFCVAITVLCVFNRPRNNRFNRYKTLFYPNKCNLYANSIELFSLSKSCYLP